MSSFGSAMQLDRHAITAGWPALWATLPRVSETMQALMLVLAGRLHV